MRVGTDIISIDRISLLIDRYSKKFIDRILSLEEQGSLSLKPQSIAGYWASKEAISKALGCGIGKELNFHDIIIYKDDKNAPYFKLSREAQNRFRIKSSSLSISHDGGFAIAVVIINI